MRFIKDNLVTILLIFFILIILLLFGIFIYIIRKESNKVNVAEIPATMLYDSKDEINSETEEHENSKKNINLEEDVSNTSMHNQKLIQIAEIFNTCEAAQEMRLKGYTMNANVTANKISIISSGEGLVFNVEFILTDNILSTDILYDETDSRKTFAKLLLAVILMDCVGQMNGIPEKELLTDLLKEDALNYTLENEGVEMKKLNNGQGIVIKINLNSNFSFLNVKN